MKVIEFYFNTEDKFGFPVEKIIDLPTKEEIRFARNDIDSWGRESGSISLTVKQRDSFVYWRLVDQYRAQLANNKTTKAEKRGSRFYYRNQLGRMIPVSKSVVTEKLNHEA